MDSNIKINQPSSQPSASEYAWLENLPEAIRDWLVSSELTYLIINLNRRLGFEGVKTTVIPDMVLQIALKELAPEKIIDELAKRLNLDMARAINLAKEMEETMLRPIENPLRRDLGVDIKRVYMSRPVPPTPIKPLAPAQPITPSIYRPAAPLPGSIPPHQPAPPTIPPMSPASKEVPVKINVQKPNEPFGPDSWVNKVK